MTKGLEIIGIAAILAVCVAIAWFFLWPEAPSFCATDMSAERASLLLRPLLLQNGFSADEVGSAQVEAVPRDGSEAWPTYSVQFRATRDGATKHYIAMGNGCGLGELFDLGAAN